MNEGHKGRVTRAALQSATSTWRAVAKNGRPPIKIAVGHLAKEQTLDDALDEYCQLREQDRSVTASQFCNRYPSYRHSLRRLIDVHDAMEQQPALEEENWPKLFSEFLGYEIIHELGVGAIARVYLAAETALGGRLVAIKVSQQGGDEAETLGKLTHPHVVPVFSVKHDDETGMTAVCMPYHGSATLADLLEIGFESGSPPASASVILEVAREREQVADFATGSAESNAADPVFARGSYVDGVVRLGIQLAEALAYTHQHGILHRDLKPSNVLLTPNGAPMLLDFNLASDMENRARRLGGTLPYMPPEQIRDVHLHPFEADLSGDPRSDIFSLGVILYELLTGKLPFGDPPAGVAPQRAAEEYLVAQEEVPRSARDINSGVSPEIAGLISKCLSPDPQERPASAAAFADELKTYFSRRRRVRRWTSRHRGGVATLAVLLMLLAAPVIWHLATRPTYAVREYIQGIDDIKEARYRDAIEHLDRAINLDDDSVPFRFARGVAYQRLGDHKQAEIDLSEAAKPLNNPVVMESCAYSLLQMPLASPGPRLAARAMYAHLSKVADLSPETQLNCAFAYYDMVSVIPLVIHRCDAALKTRPDWQDAYYLRAIAHASEAQQILQRKEGERDEIKLTKSINDARLDFERAISIGPPSCRLFMDAAGVYRLPSANPPSERLQQLLRAAAQLGMPQSYLKALGDKHGWLEEPWFQELDSLCSGKSTLYSIPTYQDTFLTPPNAELVDAKLEAYRSELELVPFPAELATRR